MADPVYPRRSIAGPIVLITIGTLLLLANFHYFSWAMLAHWFARYWPALIIVWGLIKLLEYFDDQRRGLRPRGIGAGGVFLLIILILFGLGATSAERVNWNALSNDMDIDSDFGSFWGNSYNFTQTMQQSFPAQELRVVSDRGSITVNAWDQPEIKVVVTKRVIADNQEQAADIDRRTQPSFTTADKTLVLNANTAGAGNRPVETNLEIYIPAKAVADLATRRGDITIHQRTGDVRIATHGDVSGSDIAGNVQCEMRRGDVRLTNVKGDVSIDGRVDDTTVSQVTGALRLSGDFFGDMNLSQVAKTVSFKSSRTDLEFARLDGTMNLQSGDLTAKNVFGPVRIQTRSKDIHLEDVTGDVTLENSNGSIELHAGRLPLGAIDITNRRGEVQVVLPEKAAFQLEATAQRGDINSDFADVKVDSHGNQARASAVIGSGGPRVQISDDNGNIEIRKGSVMEAAPAAPATPAEPAKPPKAPKAKVTGAAVIARIL